MVLRRLQRNCANDAMRSASDRSSQHSSTHSGLPTKRKSVRVLTSLSLLIFATLAFFNSREPVLAADSPSADDLAAAPPNIANEQNTMETLSFQQRDQVALENRGRTFGRTYPAPDLELVSVDVSREIGRAHV